LSCSRVSGSSKLSEMTSVTSLTLRNAPPTKTARSSPRPELGYVLVHGATSGGCVRSPSPVGAARDRSQVAVLQRHDAARPLLLGPTERFVIEGQPGTSLFLIGEGEVEVRLRREDGRDWLADTMGRGQIVGEMALITGGLRTATVRSVGEAVVSEIGRQQYEPLLREYLNGSTISLW
jgi:hypothetical protein